MEVLGIIPARGGSERVPNKNIRDLNGKPLIAYTLEQAETASSLDRCIVSTDDDEIATVARKYGGDVPFIRPSELATNTVSSMAVVDHALDWAKSNEMNPEIVVLLQVTCPLRSTQDINQAVDRLRRRDAASSIISTTAFQNPPHWALSTDDQGFLASYFDEGRLWGKTPDRSQDLPKLSHPNGAIFAAEVPAFRESRTFYTESTLEYKMPPDRSIDIDEPFDLELVRALVEYRDDK